MIPRLNIEFGFRQFGDFFHRSPDPVLSEDTYAFDHARSAIVVALRSLDLPANSKVGIMVYNCHTVMNAIHQVQCKPEFVDVNDDLTVDYDDLKVKAVGMSALIITHLFGIINDVESIRRDFPGLPIIEDCAHAYPFNTIFGDFATYSIGQGKFPSIGDGGLLFVNNKSYVSRVKELYDFIPDYGRLQSIKLVFKLWAKAILYRPYVYGAFTFPSLKWIRKNIDVDEQIRPRKMSCGIRRLYSDYHDHVAERVAYQQQNAEELIRRFKFIEGVKNTICGCNAFMLVVEADDINSLMHSFKGKNVEIGTHFRRCIDWAMRYGYKLGECPNAERLINRLIMVPTYTAIEL